MSSNEAEKKWFTKFLGNCHYGVCWTRGCRPHPTAIDNKDLFCFDCYINKKLKKKRG